MLTERMTYLIDSKAKDINKNPHRYYKDVSKRIKKLNDYIDGKIKLDDKVIEKILTSLLQATIFLNIPLPKGTNIARARKYDEDKDKICFSEVEKLSYIPRDEKDSIKLRRMNKKAESMFYGCISIDDNNIGTAFSEVDAVDDDIICILDSTVESELFLRPIGIFSYYSIGGEAPWIIHQVFKDMYDYFRKVFTKRGMDVVNKCDTFFAAILKQKESIRLYDVTSILASICMEGDTDGIIYPSVKGDDAPNIVIKPDSIDTKVRYTNVRSFLITEKLGDVLYRANVLQQTIVRIKN